MDSSFQFQYSIYNDRPSADFHFFFDMAVADALVLGLLHTEAVVLTDEVLPKQQDIWFFLPSTTSQTKSPIPMGLLYREFTFLIISALQLIWKQDT